MPEFYAQFPGHEPNELLFVDFRLSKLDLGLEGGGRNSIDHYSTDDPSTFLTLALACSASLCEWEHLNCSDQFSIFKSVTLAAKGGEKDVGNRGRSVSNLLSSASLIS